MVVIEIIFGVLGHFGWRIVVVIVLFCNMDVCQKLFNVHSMQLHVFLLCE